MGATLQLLLPSLIHAVKQARVRSALNLWKGLNRMPKDQGGFYAVKRGRCTGIFLSWADCHTQVDKYPGAVFKKFPTRAQALEFIGEASKPELSSRATASSAPAPAAQAVQELRLVVDAGAVNSLTLEDGHVVVYTDGSALRNGRVGSRAGVGVFWGYDHPWNVGLALEGVAQTNQRAELQAAIVALEQLQQHAVHNPVEIRTDSKYTIKAMTEWVPKWEERGRNGGWITTSGRPPENEDLLRRLATLCRQRGKNIRWTYVPGHQGVPGNDAADALAKLGARSAVLLERDSLC